MTDRLIVDLDGAGRVRVSTVEDGEPPQSDDPAEFARPLDEDALEDLRWYLEDYLLAPYGVYEDRGSRIEAELTEWGQQLFRAALDLAPRKMRTSRARARGDVELVFRSNVPELLGLPWELIADPGRSAPPALSFAGVGRSLLMPASAAEAVPVPDGRLRVLMAISRPAGGRDVEYQMIARPLLSRLEAVRGQVDLVVLRPPTLDALHSELHRAAAAETPYQIVHFDGHGVLLPDDSRTVAASPAMHVGAGEGLLAFEKPGGGADLVPASVVARVLKDAKVPVVVLNACQSGAVGKELEATVATRLLREGVASVVAMAYSVYAVAAAEFMAAFYERLFAGGTVSSAVTAGRRQMSQNRGRPSPKGDLPLRDWLVPVHYFRRDVSFPQARVERPADLPPLTDALRSISRQNVPATSDALYPTDGVFIGRDALFYDLEQAARLQKVVVLTGSGGTGKTELAKAFGRWWRDTGGIDDPSLVLWHSFEPGVATFGLDGVITEVGLAVFGTEFARLEQAERLELVKQLLLEHRLLLLWDNFESVREMPDPPGVNPALNEDERAALKDFLTWMRDHSKSTVLITSRTQESWLGEVGRIRVGGLTHARLRVCRPPPGPFPAAQEKRHINPSANCWNGSTVIRWRALTLPRLAQVDAATLLADLREPSRSLERTSRRIGCRR